MGIKDIHETVKRQREYFDSFATRGTAFRKEMLKQLRNAIEKHEQELYIALKEDLHKSEKEAFLTELSIVYQEIGGAMRNLTYWARTRLVRSTLAIMPSNSYIRREPLGVALIMAPWNYPVNLLLTPLVGAIAAGCTAVLKSSPYTPHVDEVMEKMITETFPSEYIAYFRGGRDVNSALLTERYDAIFFTGNPTLGRIVMEAASKHLTPTVLELGGKSPCIVDKKANIELAAKRIAWGKTLNAGQTCIAPDYILIHKDIKDKFIEKTKNVLKKLYGEDPSKSEYYPRIVSGKAMKRLVPLMNSGGRIVIGGAYDMDAKYIAPTYIDNIQENDTIMQEEIFGPIMPMMEFSDSAEAISYINKHEKPLALYYFGDKTDGWNMIRHTSSGGACINDVIMHIANPFLPFGGVGNSGMGRYHHKETYEAFTHKRSVLVSYKSFEFPFKYPPFKLFDIIRNFLK